VLGDLILGIIGAFVGGWVTGILFGQDLVNGFNTVSLMVAVSAQLSSSRFIAH